MRIFVRSWGRILWFFVGFASLPTWLAACVGNCQSSPLSQAGHEDVRSAAMTCKRYLNWWLSQWTLWFTMSLLRPIIPFVLLGVHSAMQQLKIISMCAGDGAVHVTLQRWFFKCWKVKQPLAQSNCRGKLIQNIIKVHVLFHYSHNMYEKESINKTYISFPCMKDYLWNIERKISSLYFISWNYSVFLILQKLLLILRKAVVLQCC